MRSSDSLINLLIYFSNVPLSCDQLVGLDLTPWKVDHNEPVGGVEEVEIATEAAEPEYEELSSDIVNSAFEKAKENLNARRQFEYESWLSQGGIDARSPDGTAASFSKANRNSLIIANTSLFYEFATNELVNALHG